MIKFSVIVPTYNRAELLVQCLESLAKQRVSKKEYEVIVVDDGSSDETPAVVNAFRNRMQLRSVIHSRNRGVAAARNSGIRAARGRYIAFVADDYEAPTTYAQTIVRMFSRHPTLSVIKFNLQTPRAPNHVQEALHAHWTYHIQAAYLTSLKQGELLRLKYSRVPFPKVRPFASTTLEVGVCAFRSGVFKRVGLFREDLTRGEDAEYAIRLAQQNIAAYFYPQIAIQRMYSKTLHAAFGNAYVSGRSQYKIKRHHPRYPLLVTNGIRKTFDRFANVIVVPLRMAARQASMLRRIRYFCMMLVIKLGGFLGECEGLLRYIVLRMIRA
ncbi:glycosyltransferase [Candidatus Woesearchaeota archaeon]|nr:glycosyltransferase [Candidatus Woesearchaeota archaeon]